MTGSEAKAIRQTTGMTQRALSEKLGISVYTVSRWESQESLDLSTEIRIRRACDQDVCPTCGQKFPPPKH